MEKLIIKNQLIFLALVIAITTTFVSGISSTRVLSQNLVKTSKDHNILAPIESYYAYRLALAESNNQTILETIISPKKTQLAATENTLSVPVLVYHGISEDNDQENISLNQFKDQMYALKNSGYQTVSIEDYTAYLLGQKTLPAKSFLLTFDDGRKDTFNSSDPILKALNYQAVMFVISSHLDGNNSYYLSNEELKSMKQSGRWTIASHSYKAHDLYPIDQKGTLGHFYSNLLWLKEQNRLETPEEFKTRVRTDMTLAKNKLADADFKTQSFAFPFGDFGQFSQNFPEAETIVPNLAVEVYSNNFYQNYKSPNAKITAQNEFNSSAAFSKRIEPESNLRGMDLIKLIEGTSQKNFPYSDPLNNIYSWETSWGESNIEDQSLLVSASPNTTGGAAFLIGSSNWRNYTASSFISWMTGNTFSFHTRVINSQNYLTCDFSDVQVKISQKINGQTEVLATKKLSEAFEPSGAKFSVTVRDNKISCFINDSEVLTSNNVNASLLTGGVGFSTWDEDLDNSAILVHNLQVSEVQLLNEAKTKAPRTIQED